MGHFFGISTIGIHKYAFILTIIGRYGINHGIVIRTAVEAFKPMGFRNRKILRF